MHKEASHIHIVLFCVFVLYGKWEKAKIEKHLIDLSTFTSPSFAWYFLVPSRLTAPGFPPSTWSMKLSHLVHIVPARSHGTLTLTGPLENITWQFKDIKYLWADCCLIEYYFTIFSLLCGWNYVNWTKQATSVRNQMGKGKKKGTLTSGS